MTHLARLIPANWRPRNYIRNLVDRKTGLTVQAGPFAGMIYNDQAIHSANIPKLLGCYEDELLGVVAQICRDKPARIIDVGAAEGYYAVGFARILPEVHIVAYELEPQGRRLLAQIAAKNKVEDRISLRGQCGVEELAADLADEKSKTVVVCDVEGFESTLLDPARIPGLKQTPILVETHDFCKPGVTDTLLERFKRSHQIERIANRRRLAREFPYHNWYTRLFPQRDIEFYINDGRPADQCWLWMTPTPTTGES